MLEITTETRNKLIVFAGSILFAILFLLPTIFPDKFKDMGWVSKPIKLGLDLVGGVHLAYEVDTKEAVKSRLNAIGTALKAELRKEKIPILQAKAGDDLALHIVLWSDRYVEKLKEKVLSDYKDLLFKGVKKEGSRVVVSFSFPPGRAKKIENEAVLQAIETLRNRIDQFGVAEPIIQRAGEKRILVQLPGVSDIQAVKKVVGAVANLEFRLLPEGKSNVPTITVVDRSGAPVVVEDEVLMTGSAVADARVNIHNGKVEVSLTLTSEGARLFRKITTENVGRRLGIILDGVLYSSPQIREPIVGGRASISGGFTVNEAKQLAVVLRAGALPAPLKILEQRTVGPTLGRESIRKGITAIIAGFVFISVFMVIYYRKSGLVAVGTLVLNVIFLLALLSLFGATLTLPGLAGLALTVGMAVDASVLIFERIREELRSGATRDAAVNAGFQKALSAIIDANITTLITGVLLFYFGTGPVRGFAVTLSIGIITTLYCASFVSRLCYDIFEIKGANAELSI